jgi:hypothetical protein
VSKMFTEAEIAEVWERRKAGEPTRSIARRLGRNGPSIRAVYRLCGAIPRTVATGVGLSPQCPLGCLREGMSVECRKKVKRDDARRQQIDDHVRRSGAF